MDQKAEKADIGVVFGVVGAILAILVGGIVIFVIIRRRHSSTQSMSEPATTEVEVEVTTIVDDDELGDGEFENPLISDEGSLSFEELSESADEGLSVL
jgi:hypothetical protein